MKSEASRRLAGGCSSLLALVLLLLAPSGAAAIEFFDGRVQIHGYGETVLRTIARDYDPSANFDLTQWHLIGNVEFEFDIAPEGFGPFDLIGAYVRVEGRYDCVWTQACGLFRSANTYGNRADRLPEQFSDARKNLFRGTIAPNRVRVLDENGDSIDWNFQDTRPRLNIPLGQDGDEFAVETPPGMDDPMLFTPSYARPVPNQRGLARPWNVPALGQLFYGLPGIDPDGVDGDNMPLDDPGLGDDDVSGCFTNSDLEATPTCRYAGVYVAENFHGYRFGAGSTRGATGGQGSRVFGPWRPKDEISAWGFLRDRVNPYNPNDEHPVLRDEADEPLVGTGALPFRPAAELDADTNGDGTIDDADDVGQTASRGIYYPSAKLVHAINDDDFDQPKVNFDQDDLALNYGMAQEQTHELKEAYLDLELLDHALWLRLGRQTIVWGKTELFRSQDQFNPQDLGLASLPSLEESRIALWSARGVYSLYDVGPFEDVRVEGAVLIDQFQPIDFGRCGEPYAPPQACDLAFGLFAHGIAGIGLAGQYQPEEPWDDYGDVEFGTRVEWRWNRLSFALSQYAGFPDLPHVETLQTWERNVDPRSGRPRRTGAVGPCDLGNEASCLGGVTVKDLEPPLDPPFLAAFPDLALPPTDDVLANHHANQQIFATICAATIGFSSLLPNGCAFNIWNSQVIVDTDADLGAGALPTVAQAFSAMLQGGASGKVVLGTLARWDTDGDRVVLAGDEGNLPLVALHANANTPPTDPGDPPPPPGAEIDGREVGNFRALSFPDICGSTPADAELCAPASWRLAGLSPALSKQQEALLGCGDYWGIDCDIHGFDLMNSEGSALTQSWPGFEGAGGSDWDPFDASVAQPGTIRFDGGPVCTRYERATRQTLVLPGCRGVRDFAVMRDVNGAALELHTFFDDGYDLTVDGCVFNETFGDDDVPVRAFFGSPGDPGAEFSLANCNDTTRTRQGVVMPVPLLTPFHPYAGCPLTAMDEIGGAGARTCTFELNPMRDYHAEFLAEDRTAQIFRSEMSALSWNLLAVLVVNSTPPDSVGDPSCAGFEAGDDPLDSDTCKDRQPRFDEFDVRDPEDFPGAPPGTIGPERLNGCSFRRPFLCKAAGPFFATTGARRATARAGGNFKYGRRDFQWHAGGIGVLDYKRRNVLGFSLDFPEDVSKTNWGVEFTWFDRVMSTDNDEFDGLTETQHFNLSISVDRPTFIRFLNSSRTFLFNSQVFLQYIDGHTRGMPGNGPVNALSTLLIATAYHQDRLIPTLVLVHDYNSVSGAVIAGITYRYSTQFSVSFGAAAFYGRIQGARPAIDGLAGANGGAGRGRNRAYVENGLSSIRDRDELSLRFRYSF